MPLGRVGLDELLHLVAGNISFKRSQPAGVTRQGYVTVHEFCRSNVGAARKSPKPLRQPESQIRLLDSSTARRVAGCLLNTN